MRPNRVRPPEGATLIVSIVGVAILAVVIGYSIGNWALGLLLSPPTEIQTSSSLDDTLKSGSQNFVLTYDDNKDVAGEQLWTTPNVTTTSSQAQSSPQIQATDVVVRGPYVGVVELYKVRVGDFFSKTDAERVRDELRGLGYKDSFVPSGLDAYAVQVGAFGSEENATSVAQALLQSGYDAYIVEQVKE